MDRARAEAGRNAGIGSILRRDRPLQVQSRLSRWGRYPFGGFCDSIQQERSPSNYSTAPFKMSMNDGAISLTIRISLLHRIASWSNWTSRGSVAPRLQSKHTGS